MDAEQILQLGTSTLLEASGSQIWLGPQIMAVWPAAAVAGPAYPVRCAPGDNLAIHVAMEKAPEGSLLVVDGAGVMCGYWGEVLTAMAQERGIAGLIINGGVRDIAALENRWFPVFAPGAGMIGTSKAFAGSPGSPVRIGGVRIAMGDCMVADRDGVIAIPQDDLERVVSNAIYRQHREAEMMAEIEAGRSTLALLGLQ